MADFVTLCFFTCFLFVFSPFLRLFRAAVPAVSVGSHCLHCLLLSKCRHTCMLTSCRPFSNWCMTFSKLVISTYTHRQTDRHKRQANFRQLGATVLWVVVQKILFQPNPPLQHAHSKLGPIINCLKPYFVHLTRPLIPASCSFPSGEAWDVGFSLKNFSFLTHQQCAFSLTLHSPPPSSIICTLWLISFLHLLIICKLHHSPILRAYIKYPYIINPHG